MVRRAELDVLITGDSTDLRRATKSGRQDLAAFGQSASTTNKRLGGMTSRISGATGRTSQFGRTVQNASFQLGDFATQVGAGTSASVALGQQLPQLLGGFGVLGAVMGAVVAIGVPLSRALLSSGESAKSLEDSIDDASSAIKAFHDASNETRKSASELAEAYGTAGAVLRGVLDDLREIRLVQANEAIDAMTASLSDMFDGFQGRATNIAQFLGGDSLDLLNKDFRDFVGSFDSLINKMQTTSDNAEKLRLALSLKRLMDENIGAFEDMNSEQREFYEGIVTIIKDLEVMEATTGRVKDNIASTKTEMRELADVERQLGQGMRLTFEQTRQAEAMVKLMKEGISASAIQAMQLAGVDITSPISSAQAAAAQLAADLGLALSNAMQLQGRLSQEDAAMAVSLTPDPAGAAAARAAGIGAFFRRNNKPESKGAANRRKSMIDSLVGDLSTAREQLEAWREEKMQILQNANAQELEALGGHNEAKLRLEEEYQRRMSQIRQNEAQQRVQTIQNWTSTVSSIMSSFGNMMDVENKKQFERQKRIRIASAVIDGIGAAVAAWYQGQKAGGPFLAAAYTAASVATTAAQIAAIQRQTYNSSSAGSGGSAGAAGSGAAQQAQQAPQRPSVNLTLIGDQGFSRAQIQQIAEAINDSSDDGTVPINIRGRR